MMNRKKYILETELNFPCVICGLCCQHVDRSEIYEDLDRGDGTCRHYDDKTRHCKEYNNRPVRCNIDKYYDIYVDGKISRAEFYSINVEACRNLWKEAVMADKWINIGPLKTADISPYNHCIGLYRHLVDGKVMYIGRAIEYNNGGFRKRLSDYRRDSDSARKHTSGRIIHAHLDKIVTEILIVGDGAEAIEETKRLEKEYIKQFSPEWNKQEK